MSSRTRERLIDVARQLFARKGIENTTMNDIATASDRGRRTIYTYFSTKSEIYQAVIEDEAARIVKSLDERVDRADDPTGRLRELMEFRVTMAGRDALGAELWFRSIFSRDQKKAGRVRSLVSTRIYELVNQIIKEGVETGVFNPVQAQRLPSIISVLIRGSDWALLRERDSASYEQWHRDCIEFIIDALKIKNENQPKQLTDKA